MTDEEIKIYNKYVLKGKFKKYVKKYGNDNNSVMKFINLLIRNLRLNEPTFRHAKNWVYIKESLDQDEILYVLNNSGLAIYNKVVLFNSLNNDNKRDYLTDIAPTPLFEELINNPSCILDNVTSSNKFVNAVIENNKLLFFLKNIKVIDINDRPLIMDEIKKYCDDEILEALKYIDFKLSVDDLEWLFDRFLSFKNYKDFNVDKKYGYFDADPYNNYDKNKENDNYMKIHEFLKTIVKNFDKDNQLLSSFLNDYIAKNNFYMLSEYAILSRFKNLELFTAACKMCYMYNEIEFYDYLDSVKNTLTKDEQKALLEYRYDLFEQRNSLTFNLTFYDKISYQSLFFHLEDEDYKKIIDSKLSMIEKYIKEHDISNNILMINHILFILKLMEYKNIDIQNHVYRLLYILKGNDKKDLYDTFNPVYIASNFKITDNTINSMMMDYIFGFGNEVDVKSINRVKEYIYEIKYISEDNLVKIAPYYINKDSVNESCKLLKRLNDVMDISCIKDYIFSTNINDLITYYIVLKKDFSDKSIKYINSYFGGFSIFFDRLMLNTNGLSNKQLDSFKNKYIDSLKPSVKKVKCK